MNIKKFILKKKEGREKESYFVLLFHDEKCAPLWLCAIIDDGCFWFNVYEEPVTIPNYEHFAKFIKRYFDDDTLSIKVIDKIVEYSDLRCPHISHSWRKVGLELDPVSSESGWILEPTKETAFSDQFIMNPRTGWVYSLKDGKRLHIMQNYWTDEKNWKPPFFE